MLALNADVNKKGGTLFKNEPELSADAGKLFSIGVNRGNAEYTMAFFSTLIIIENSR